MRFSNSSLSLYIWSVITFFKYSPPTKESFTAIILREEHLGKSCLDRFTDQHIFLRHPECLTWYNLTYVIKTKLCANLKKLKTFYWLFLETMSCKSLYLFDPVFLQWKILTKQRKYCFIFYLIVQFSVVIRVQNGNLMQKFLKPLFCALYSSV